MNPMKQLSIMASLSIFMVLAGSARGQQGPSVAQQFIGTWKLVLWESRRSDGEVIEPRLGRKAVGWIMYDANGRMCVQIMRPDRPRFSSDDIWGGTSEEKKVAYEGYVAYCGTYEVNEEEGTVTHHVVLSLFPNWIGTAQRRFFELSGDRLTLRTPPILVAGDRVTSRLTWERLR